MARKRMSKEELESAAEEACREAAGRERRASGGRSRKDAQVALRLTAGVVARAEALAAVMAEAPIGDTARVTKALVYRLAIQRGLASLEAEYGVAVRARPQLTGGE